VTADPGRRLGLPDLGDGVGLRDVHFAHLMRTPPADWGVGWFEIISENFLDHHGYPAHVLETIAAHRPLVMHGVSLSIGGSAPLDRGYVAKLRELAERVRAVWISDHLCWTGVGGVNTHDLLPMPLTEASLAHVADRVRAVQDWLGRPLVLENPSSYLEFRASRMPEWEFLGRLAEHTGCGLLLDVNNVFVSASNHGFDPYAYLDAFPLAAVGEIHLAGHSLAPTEHGDPLVIDTHGEPVTDAVFELYRHVLKRGGPIPSLIERDNDVPEWPMLTAEIDKARGFMAAADVQRNTECAA
jgi:hypothetical protein